MRYTLTHLGEWDPSDVNDRGQVVGGFAGTESGTAIVYEDGVSRDLGGFGGYWSDASGQVVGWADTADGQRHAFLYWGGRMRDLRHLRRGICHCPSATAATARVATGACGATGTSSRTRTSVAARP